ncbi:OLC1v1000276C2 [Oldenlandia corymbosa var. corymbosa]|uniref:Eukaryotic translation initiation factor 4G n=1 Tax=Oldenlandia corymbosa var. corymbosa TaxID=529605 RepID=A0AAV1D2K1_OLDCO|nr:OLC1v1000276C2 [Oldenlandia corymbosa var. corymbosa]
MSHNQSRGERTESAQYRKSGRSNHHRNFSGGGHKGNTGTGGGATAPPSNTNINTNNNQPTLSSNRSFKKHHNVQGGQPRTGAPAVNPDSTAPAPRAVQNGSHPSQQHSHGAQNTPSTVAAVKPADVVTPKASRAPRAPSSNVPSASGDSKNTPTPVTPSKAEVPPSYTLQFGSISPGFMNGMQIPARTSSAPPNLDEQKRDQARRDSVRVPPPAIPRQQLPKKDAGPVDQPTAIEGYPPAKPKREVQTSAAPPVSQPQKPSVLPIPGVPIQVPFHQHQLPVQFGTPNPQIQSQAMSATSLPVPMAIHMPLQIGNPSVQPQVFVPGLQPHHMQPQSILHQSQFSSQMGPQVPAQVGPHHMTPQFPQQQAGKFGGPRKAVKITHPDTHEELRLDGSASRPHSSLAPQSQPISSFPPAHPSTFYPGYNANPVYFPAPSSHPLSSSTLPPSQPPRYYGQVTLKPAASSHGEKDAISSVNSPRAPKGDPQKSLKASQMDAETSLQSSLQQPKSVVGPTSVTVAEATKSVTQPGSESGQSLMLNSIAPGSPSPVETPLGASSIAGRLDSSQDQQDKVYAEQEIMSEPSDRLDAQTIEENRVKTEISGKNQGQATFSEQSKIVEEALMSSASDSTTLSAENGEGSSPPGIGNAEACPPNEGKASSLGGFESTDIEDNVIRSSSTSIEESMSALAPSSDENVEHDHSIDEDNKTLAAAVAVTKDKLEQNVTKGNAPRSKKKRKELLKKLDSSGPTSDLYMAYKGPEEKKEGALTAETVESTSSNNLEHLSSEVSRTEITKDKAVQGKLEPDDWEDAADISTPKLETPENEEREGKSAELNSEVMTKKYSRDFLLKFAEQFTELPEGFQVIPETAEAFVVSNIGTPRDPYTPGRIIDRRVDRRPSNIGEEDKWNKPLMPGRDGPNVVTYRPSPMPVLRYPRPLVYPGVLPGQNPAMVPQVGLPRNPPDADRWPRASHFQKGLIPTPLQVMHKAERKYEIGKVTDEEQAKQRQLKGILNKLTPQNFEKLFEQVKQVNIDNAITLTGVISQIFDKALMEPTFCEMYANFCSHLAVGLPDLSVDNEKITFKRLLLNKCQEEFERGEREQEEANQVDVKGEAKQSAEEREEMRLRARRRMLGNIRLIGELYKKRMLTERIMHECIKKLLGQYQNPDEEDVEALCKLMSTIGEMIDHPKAKEHMDVYFDMMEKLSNNMKLSSRVRFMLKDAIDLRKNKWQQRRKVEGPKKIEEVHRDAAQERQAQTRGLARTPSMGPSVRRSQPTDFSPRGSNILASPSSQMGGYRAVPPQIRGYGGQDVRIEERHTMDNRTLSVPLPQRPLGDDAPFLGPQGGLARGMSFRGHSASPGIQLPDSGETRRLGPGLNGYNPVSERTAHSSREDPVQRYMPERFVGPSAYEQSSAQEWSSPYGNRDTRNPDRGFDRSLPLSPPAQSMGALTQNAVSEKVWPEERLRDMSMSTIKEFYSAKDENEVALCIKDLNNPSFYPSMISLWVTDSFERKDKERDLLTKLLITLTKYREGLISQDQLIKGFDSVLMTLEDAVNDAPKAAEFLGRIFAGVILESVVPLGEIERIIHEGGEERGRLVEIGLAAEVLGTTLEVIASERGDSGLKEFRSGSSLKLETFRPPGSNKSWRIDKFI